MKRKSLLGYLLAATTTAFIACCSTVSQTKTVRPVSEAEASGWPGVRIVADQRAQRLIGKRIAQERCAICHAIDSKSLSPRLGAPPLRDVIAMYDPDEIAYRLIDGMAVGHGDMPVFDFDVPAADALTAYLLSIAGD